jgi:hypothetical protein
VECGTDLRMTLLSAGTGLQQLRELCLVTMIVCSKMTSIRRYVPRAHPQLY